MVTASAGQSSSGVTSSFAGGSSYTIISDNLYESLKLDGNRVEVCGNVCELDHENSSGTQAVCLTPALATTHSASTYQISDVGVVHGKWTGSVQVEVDKVTDGVWATEYTDPAANCWIEIDFPDTQVAVLDNVRILINNLDTTKVPFADVTKLQGWDGAAYVDILTLDSTIHEGWNTFEWDTSKPAYQKYKWTGATAGSCRFGEIKFHGIVAVDDTNTSTVCTPKLWIGGVSTDLNAITYDDASTATVTSVTPRYGKV